MTKKEFRELCNKYQEGEFSEGFNAFDLIQELFDLGYDWEDLQSHDSVKEWFKSCIDNEWNIGPLITEWYADGFADYYKIDFSMGTIAKITALAVADDFYEAFEDRFDD